MIPSRRRNAGNMIACTHVCRSLLRIPSESGDVEAVGLRRQRDLILLRPDLPEQFSVSGNGVEQTLQQLFQAVRAGRFYAKTHAVKAGPQL